MQFEIRKGEEYEVQSKEKKANACYKNCCPDNSGAFNRLYYNCGSCNGVALKGEKEHKKINIVQY